MAIYNSEAKEFYCECGCGEVCNPFSNYRSGHNSRTEEYLRVVGPKISRALIGRVFSEEHCRNLSEAEYQSYRDDSALAARRSESNRGQVRSAETCKRLSEARLRSYREDPTIADKISKSKLGTYLGPPSESHSRALSEANRRQWARLSPEARRKRLQPAWDARGGKPNQGESLLDEWLQETYPGEWKYVGDNQIRIGNRNPDFINVNGKKAVIELFGSYYHDPVYFPEKRTEEETLEDYEKYGFDCLVVWYGIPDDLVIEWITIVDWIRSLEGK